LEAHLRGETVMRAIRFLTRLIALWALVALPHAAQASVDLVPLLSLGYSLQSKGAYCVGGGVLARNAIGGKFQAELGVQYVGHGLSADGASNRFYMIELPLSLRYRIKDSYALGLGAYYELSLEGRSPFYGMATHVEYSVPSARKIIVRAEYLRNMALADVFTNTLILSLGYKF